MEKFVVHGGIPLSGSITPSGNKNEALPVLAATLLAQEPVILHNVPDILDITIMRGLLESLGVEVKQIDKHSFSFDPGNLQSANPDSTQASRIRGSFLLAGPLLARKKSIVLPAPGGDRIGLRPVQTHLSALEKLGARIDLNENGFYQMQTSGLKGTQIYLDEASVMATENAVMAAVTAQGKTNIYNAACEPHVQGLCHFLKLLGANIEGIGSNLLVIEGVSGLSGGEYTIQPDHTEVGSFIGLAAVTGSELRIRNAGVQYLRMTQLMFEKLGVEIQVEGDDLLIPKKQKLIVRKDPSGGIPKIDADAPLAFGRLMGDFHLQLAAAHGQGDHFLKAFVAGVCFVGIGNFAAALVIANGRADSRNGAARILRGPGTCIYAVCRTNPLAPLDEWTYPRTINEDRLAELIINRHFPNYLPMCNVMNNVGTLT